MRLTPSIAVRDWTVFHGLRQILWLLRPDGSIERFNTYWTDYTGLPGQFEDLSWADVFHPEDRQRLVNTRKLGVASGQPYEVEARMRRVDGVYRRHLCRVAPLLERNEIVGWLGTAIDVEEVRAAEDAAREAERRKQAVLRSISDGYYRLDRHFRLVDVNAVFERMVGRSREEVLGRSLWAVFPEAPPASDYNRVALGCALSEERWSAAAGCWVEISIYHSPDGFEAYFRDIDGRKRAEAQQAALVALGDQLRDSQDPVAMGAVAASVVGNALGACRVGYVICEAAGEIAVIQGDWVADASARRARGRYRVSDWGSFLECLRRGETVAVHNVDCDPLTAYAVTSWHDWGISSFVLAPVIRHGRLAAYMFVHSAGERAWRSDEVAFIRNASDRAWSAMRRAEGEAELANTARDVAFALKAGGLGAWTLDLSTGVLTTSEICRANFGRDPKADFPYDDLVAAVHPDDRTRMAAAVERSITSGEDYAIQYRAITPGGETRWVSVCGRLAYEAGQPVRMTGVSQDITERKQEEQHRELLVGELLHRVRNTLAVVQATAQQTLRGRVPDAVMADFAGRLAALARAQDVLTQSNWDTVLLRELLDRTLAPFARQADGRVLLDGIDLRLEAHTAVSFALAFHELATNAAKYGALSNAEGTVLIRWRVAREAGIARLQLTWREGGGPPVAAPARRGFGSRMIERALAKELRGDVRIHFAPDGVRCVIDAPLPTVSRASGHASY